MLYTVDTGKVTSKPASLEWAKHELPPEWHGLIQQALDDPRPRLGRPATRRKRRSDNRIADCAKEHAANSRPA